MSITGLMSFIYAILQLSAMVTFTAAGTEYNRTGGVSSGRLILLRCLIIFAFTGVLIGYNWYATAGLDPVGLILLIWIDITGPVVLAGAVFFRRMAAIMDRIVSNRRRGLLMIWIATMLSVILITLGAAVPGQT